MHLAPYMSAPTCRVVAFPSVLRTRCPNGSTKGFRTFPCFPRQEGIRRTFVGCLSSFPSLLLSHAFGKAHQSNNLRIRMCSRTPSPIVSAARCGGFRRSPSVIRLGTIMPKRFPTVGSDNTAHPTGGHGVLRCTRCFMHTNVHGCGVSLFGQPCGWLASSSARIRVAKYASVYTRQCVTFGTVA